MLNTNKIEIITAATADDYVAAKQLFIQYQNYLGEDLCFQSFEEELLQIPLMYAPSGGNLLLAKYKENYIGCVAFRNKTDSICEMKRLYVSDQYKQQGIGRLLIENIIQLATVIGYKQMILDTLERLAPALHLYKAYGFKEINAYYPNPLQGVIYMELSLF